MEKVFSRVKILKKNAYPGKNCRFFLTIASARYKEKAGTGH
jgi:hypothetical protein